MEGSRDAALRLINTVIGLTSDRASKDDAFHGERDREKRKRTAAERESRNCGIDDEGKGGRTVERERERARGKIRRRESRYVSLDMFLSGVKLSRGFMCLFISPLSRHVVNMYREAESTRDYTHVVDRVRALPIGSRVLL